MCTRYSSFVALISLISLSRGVCAEDITTGPAHHFGDETQLAISSDAAFNMQHASAAGQSTSIEFDPAADYFVMKNLSVGGSLGFFATLRRATRTPRVSRSDRAPATTSFFRICSRCGRSSAFHSHTRT
jgi:hypothetical protein